MMGLTSDPALKVNQQSVSNASNANTPIIPEDPANTESSRTSDVLNQRPQIKLIKPIEQKPLDQSIPRRKRAPCCGSESSCVEHNS
jgi:hypothetical protein